MINGHAVDASRDAALQYARAKWPLLPLDDSLVPLEHEPSTDLNQIALWWGRHPSAMPGVVLGHLVGRGRLYLVALINRCTPESNRYLEARGALDALGLGHLNHFGGARAWLFASPEPMPSRELCPGLEVQGQGVLPLPPAHDHRGEWSWRKGHFLPERPLTAAPHWLRIADPEPAREPDHPMVGDDWVRELTRTENGGIRPTLANAALILRCDDRWAGRLAYDEMSMSVAFTEVPMRDAHVVTMREQIERRYGVALSDQVMRDALCGVSDERRFHPVRAYLRGLKWDGVARIARVPSEILRMNPTALDHAMLRCWLISAVARPCKPGCKVDTALVLVGDQGTFKSTFFRVLADPWFSDSYMDITNKDSLMQLASAWIYEWSEIEAVTNSRQAGDIKKFVTSQSDTFRPPFGRKVERVPRSGVIVGTTNEDRFLNDETGSRRFWVLRVPSIVNRDLLERWRDQLWAEAMAALNTDEAWWLGRPDETTREERAEEFSVIDPWTERLTHWIHQNPSSDYTAMELMADALSLPSRDQHSGSARRIGRTMRSLGYMRHKSRPVREGRTLPPSWVWRKEGESSENDSS